MNEADSSHRGNAQDDRRDPAKAELEDFSSRLDWQAFRAGQDRAPGGDWGDCPAPDQIAALARGDSVPEREALVDHVLACPGCRLEVRTVLSGEDFLDQALSEPPGGVSDGEQYAPRLSQAKRALFAVAATLLLVFGLTWWWQGRGSADTEVLRDAGTEVVKPSVEPADGSRLDAAPNHLRWQPQAGATFQVVMYDEELERLWESDPSTEPSVELPASLRRELLAGSVVFWRVISRREVQTRQTPLYQFEIVTIGADASR